MRTWRRAPVSCRCGLCGELIEVGAPMVTVAIPGLSRPLLRCRICVGGEPPDLPALLERTPVSPSPFTKVGPLAGAVPFDYKQAQAGRDPGEDG